MKVTYNFDQNKCQASFLASASLAQKWLDNEVIKDTDKYVPMLDGTLKDSAVRNSIIGSGIITYNTPYARRQYYSLPKKSKSRHPLAVMRWFETSKGVNLSKWLQGAKKLGGKRD